MSSFYLQVHVTAGSRTTKVGGLVQDALRVKVSARAIDGAANEAVKKAVSAAFGVPERHVDIVRGLTSRRKMLLLEGNSTTLQERFDALASST